MDSSTHRRGRLCWHRLNNVGLRAINDSLMLNSLIDLILRTDWDSTTAFVPMLDAINEARLLTSMGQHLDVTSSNRMDLFEMPYYSEIVRLKTSHYSFLLPLKLALLAVRFSHLHRTSLKYSARSSINSIYLY